MNTPDATSTAPASTAPAKKPAPTKTPPQPKPAAGKRPAQAKKPAGAPRPAKKATPAGAPASGTSVAASKPITSAPLDRTPAPFGAPPPKGAPAELPPPTGSPVQLPPPKSAPVRLPPPQGAPAHLPPPHGAAAQFPAPVAASSHRSVIPPPAPPQPAAPHEDPSDDPDDVVAPALADEVDIVVAPALADEPEVVVEPELADEPDDVVEPAPASDTDGVVHEVSLDTDAAEPAPVAATAPSEAPPADASSIAERAPSPVHTVRPEHSDLPVAASTSEKDSLFTPTSTAVVGKETRTGSWLRARGRTLVYLLPVLVVSAIVNVVNIAGAPQRTEAEGVYTGQAWLLNTFGQLTHYTYWSDHPQVGWLQLAGYTRLTGAFGRWDATILAGREFMIVVALISVVLVWALARRVHLSRPAASAASLIFALSPLAVVMHRSVLMDNIAVAWLLVALLLGMSKRAQLAAFLCAAGAFGIAVLSKETFLLALPLLAWVMVRGTRRGARLQTLSLAAGVFAAVIGVYLLLANLANSAASGSTRASATDAFLFQNSAQAGSGSLLDPDSPISRAVGSWAQLDPVLIAVALVAAAVGVMLYRTRPFAVFVLAAVVFVLVPFVYVPASFVVILIPFAALVIAGVADAAVTWIRARGLQRSWFALPIIAFVAVGAVVAVPVWGVKLTGLVASDSDQAQRAAQQWLLVNAQPTDRIIVGDTMWADLVRAGWARDAVVRYDEIDASASGAGAGWQSAQYVVSTGAVRSAPNAFEQATEAIANSVSVASFGTGSQAVDVRLIDPAGAAAEVAVQDEAAQTRAQFGAELAQNPGVLLSDDDRALLTRGDVDARIALVLGALAASGEVTVDGFPAVDGEADLPRRQVALTEMAGADLVRDGKLTTEAYALVGGLRETFAPTEVVVDDDRLLLTYAADADPAVN